MFTLKQLRDTAKSMGLIRLSKLRKAELDILVKAKLTGGEVPLRHIQPTVICKAFLKTSFAEWDCANLSYLTVELLKHMCDLMGFKKSGKKIDIINRFVTAQGLYATLKHYNKEGIGQLADSFTAKELKALLKQARTVHKASIVPVKYAMAASLINWRDNCVARGMRFYRQCKQQLRTKREQKQTENREFVAA
jgi:hypothetical protein